MIGEKLSDKNYIGIQVRVTLNEYCILWKYGRPAYDTLVEKEVIVGLGRASVVHGPFFHLISPAFR